MNATPTIFAGDMVLSRAKDVHDICLSHRRRNKGGAEFCRGGGRIAFAPPPQ